MPMNDGSVASVVANGCTVAEGGSTGRPAIACLALSLVSSAAFYAASLALSRSPMLLLYSFAAFGAISHSSKYTNSPIPAKAKITKPTRMSVTSTPV